MKRGETSPPGPLPIDGGGAEGREGMVEMRRNTIRGRGETSPPGPLPNDGEGEGAGRGVTGRAFITEEMKQRARGMRQKPTGAEAAAWEILRERRCLGLKFRRQQVFQGFILDFYCAEIRTAIELDGPIHEEQRRYDETRTRILASHGIRVLRVRNHELSSSLLTSLLTPLLPPLPIDGEGAGG